MLNDVEHLDDSSRMARSSVRTKSTKARYCGYPESPQRTTATTNDKSLNDKSDLLYIVHIRSRNLLRLLLSARY